MLTNLPTIETITNTIHHNKYNKKHNTIKEKYFKKKRKNSKLKTKQERKKERKKDCLIDQTILMNILNFKGMIHLYSISLLTFCNFISLIINT